MKKMNSVRGCVNIPRLNLFLKDYGLISEKARSPTGRRVSAYLIHHLTNRKNFCLFYYKKDVVRAFCWRESIFGDLAFAIALAQIGSRGVPMSSRVSEIRHDLLRNL